MHPSKRIRHGERHHWWPIGLSKRWAREDGRINTISHYGVPKAYYPKEIAKISDGHNIIIGGSWDETFEYQFSQPDSNFPAVVEWLEGFPVDAYQKENRVRAAFLDDAWRLKLSQCVASLIVRSPLMRYKIYLMLRHYRSRDSQSVFRAPNHLIAANMNNLYDIFSSSIYRSGRFSILLSSSNEFIFGDGFLHNFPINWCPEPMNPVCLIPLSPKVSVLFQRPLSMWSEPREVYLTLSSDEVNFCNETIQVYSKDWLYYKNIRPEISLFQTREHQCWSMPGEWGPHLHAHPILNSLKRETLDYHTYS